MAAARKTEGDGRTSAIKQSKAIAVALKRSFIRLKMNCIHHKTKLETIAKFAPLTATKCIKPERFIAVLNSALCLAVSPSTIPGINAPASPSPDKLRSPYLIAASDLAHREASVRIFTSPSISISAAIRPSLLLIIREVALKLCPGSNFKTFARGVITRIGMRIPYES